MKLPFRLFLFLGVTGYAYLHVAPKRARFVASLREQMGLKQMSAEDSARALVQKKIRTEICPMDDLCEYQPVRWEDYYRDADGASIIHEFTADNSNRKFLFRIRSGQVAEIIDMR